MQWRPHQGKPQERFLSCSAFETLYGGQAGGAKTESLLMWVLRPVAQPGYRGLLLRRTFPELERSILPRAFQFYPLVGGQEMKGGKLWRWPHPEGDSYIELASMEREEDRFKYSSAEYQRIAFDELTTFTRLQYTFLMSRLRSSRGIATRVAGATNPGGPGHEWVLDRFAPWLYRPETAPADYDGPFAAPEQRLWVLRNPDTGDEEYVERGTPGATSRVFFPARLEDNPSLDRAEYARSLAQLDPVTYAQLAGGDWLARPAAGAFFKPQWWKRIDIMPLGGVKRRVRYWDRAATEPNTNNTDPDWTVGVRMALMHDGLIVVEDVVRERVGPSEVQDIIVATAIDDDRLHGGCEVWLEQDGGQAGIVEIRLYADLLARFAWGARPVSGAGSKEVRAKPWSAAVHAGRVALVLGKWNGPFKQCHHDFPEGKHDDDVDAASGAYHVLAHDVSAAEPSRDQGRRGTVGSMHRAGGGY